MSAPLSQQARNLAVSRAQVPHTSMFLRMLMRAAVLRRGRAASAFFAMVVAAAVATAMLNLYVDVQAKLRREFRNYGANIILVAKNGASLPADALSRVDSVLSRRDIAAPFGLIVARTSDGQPIVVAGTDFGRVRQLDKWWSVNNWPSAPKQALVGVRALPVVSPKGEPFDLTFQGHTLHVTPAGTVQTGAAEDSRIYISLSDFDAWTTVQPSTIEVAASGSPDEVNGMMRADWRNRFLLRMFVRCGKSSKAKLAYWARRASTLLAAAVLIILTAALCVLSTLMGWVYRPPPRLRHHESVGRLRRSLFNGFFAAEAAALGRHGCGHRISARNRYRRLDWPR